MLCPKAPNYDMKKNPPFATEPRDVGLRKKVDHQSVHQRKTPGFDPS